MNFEIECRDYGHRNEEHGEDRWDYDWEERHAYFYGDAHIVDKGYTDVGLFPGEREPGQNDTIYVVYVEYDTGDSFGREYGRREHLWAFTDADRASRLCELIMNDAESYPDYDFDHKPLMFEGVPTSTNTWKGYFEQFNYADLEPLEVKEKKIT